MITKKLKRREKNKSTLSQPATADPKKNAKQEEQSESTTESYEKGQLPSYLGSRQPMPNANSDAGLSKRPVFQNPPFTAPPSMTQSSFENFQHNASPSPERKLPNNPINASEFKRVSAFPSNDIPKVQLPPNSDSRIPIIDQSAILPDPPEMKIPIIPPNNISRLQSAPPSTKNNPTFQPPKSNPQQITPKSELIANPKIAIPTNPPPFNLPQNPQNLPNLPPGGPTTAPPSFIKPPNLENPISRRPPNKESSSPENLSPTKTSGIDAKTPGDPSQVPPPVFGPKESEFLNGFSEFLDLVIPYVNFVSLDPTAPSTLSQNLDAAIESSSGKLKNSLQSLKKQVLCVECKLKPYQMAFGCCHQFCFDCAQKVISSQSDAKRFIVDREINIYRPKCSKCKYQLNKIDVVAANYDVINETLTKFASEGSAILCKGCGFYKHPYQFFDGLRCHHLCKECIGIEIRRGIKQCSKCGSKFDFLHEALPDQGYCDGCNKILFTIGNSLTSVCSKGHLHCLDCLNLRSPVCIRCREPISIENKEKIDRVVYGEG
ncbi:unnamed protein product [Blepharisma stoltei]|uniref:RING-type domain-containing protein n=1 Tax=Blepharisma stoltei TaxID=1481888 RepID=A0AAU9IBW8_9CILI|nr:unnamed protein product [Blepharisma stoltei]